MAQLEEMRPESPPVRLCESVHCNSFIFRPAAWQACEISAPWDQTQAPLWWECRVLTSGPREVPVINFKGQFDNITKGLLLTLILL